MLGDVNPSKRVSRSRQKCFPYLETKKSLRKFSGKESLFLENLLNKDPSLSHTVSPVLRVFIVLFVIMVAGTGIKIWAECK